MVSIPAGADGASNPKSKNSLAPGADGALDGWSIEIRFYFFIHWNEKCKLYDNLLFESLLLIE